MPPVELPSSRAAVDGSETLQVARGAGATEQLSMSPLFSHELEAGKEDAPAPVWQLATTLQVRAINTALVAEERDLPSTATPDRLLEPMTLVHDSELGERIYRRLEQGGYLTRPEPRSENFFVRSIDAIFEPEVVRVGGFSVSCSVITAIKRRNPLCLINPLVLHVSW